MDGWYSARESPAELPYVVYYKTLHPQFKKYTLRIDDDCNQHCAQPGDAPGHDICN